MTEFLKIAEVFDGVERKTRVFNVYSAHSKDYLGQIKWSTGWRRYTLEVEYPSIWSVECLAQAYKFIQQLMNERKKCSQHN